MALVYKSICAELDELTVKILYLTEKHVQCKLEVEKLMNNGFLNIAKTRYIMGTKCVSTLQLPTANSSPISPVTVVHRTENKGHWEFRTRRKKPSGSEETINREKCKYDTVNADVIKDLFEDHSKNIRKRKEFYLVEDGNYRELNDELQDNMSTDSSDSNESLVTYTDPIRMFGVLVPFSLRVAQKNFQDVLEVLMTCATVQSETDKVLKRYDHLKKIKTLIEDVSEEKGFDLTKEKEYWTSSETISDTSAVIEPTSKSTSSKESVPFEGESEVEKEDHEKEVSTIGEDDKSVIPEEIISPEDMMGEAEDNFDIGSTLTFSSEKESLHDN